MGLFGGIKSNWKKSEAAVIVQNQLEMVQKGWILDSSHDPSKLATLLVATAWDSMPDVFNGKFGQRPHKLSVAAIAFALGIQTSNDDEYQSALLVALGNILSHIDVNGSFYPFNSTDERILLSASQVFALKSKVACDEYDMMFSDKNGNIEFKSPSSPKSVPTRSTPTYSGYSDNKSNAKLKSNTVPDSTGNSEAAIYSNYNEWYVIFKNSASKTNKALCEVNGISPIDSMDISPFRAAFMDRVDPVYLGGNLGRSYDPSPLKRK